MTTERILSQEQYHGLIKELTRTDGYLLLHKKLIEHLGGFIALVLSNYVDKHIYFEKKNPAANGWFFLTLDQQQQQLGVPRSFLIKYKKIIVELGFLKIERRGLPSKEWFKLDYEKLAFVYLHEAEKDMMSPDFPMGLGTETSGRQAKANRSRLINSKDGCQVTSKDECQATTNLRSLYKENIFKENKENNKSINTLVCASDNAPPTRNKYIKSSQFERIWNIYPNKKNKGGAIKTWNSFTGSSKKKPKPTYRELRKAIREFKKCQQWQNPVYIPMFTTFMNQFRWLNDPHESLYPEIKPKATNTNGSRGTDGKKPDHILYKDNTTHIKATW